MAHARLCSAAAALLLGCTSNPYFIGAVDQAGADTDPNLSFAIDLDHSGASFLGSALELPSTKVPAALVLRGEQATPQAWPSDHGALSAASTLLPTVALPAPFTDGTRAAQLTANDESYVGSGALGAVGTRDFALEVVLRGAPGVGIATISAPLERKGWSLSTTADGALALALQDATQIKTVTSEPLVTDAWYHCLIWVSRTAGGRVDCNGRAGPTTDLSALGDLQSSSALSVGYPGGGSIAAQLGYFALYLDAAGALADNSSWLAVSRQRFAALTGISPRVARGTLLPEPGLRDAPAYLDLQQSSGSTRQLFIVGPDWPRISCRSDDSGAHDCGYLSEAKRTRWIPNLPSAWSADALTVTANSAAFADGKQRMDALVPSEANGTHALAWTGTYGGARQVLSVFARAESGHLLALSVGALDPVVFDVRAGSVVAAPAAGDAHIEAWGDGLFRCSYGFAPAKGALTYRVQPWNDVNAQPFAGDGSAWLDIAELQLDVGQAYVGSVLAADSQPADQLTFIADDGNLPSSNAVSERLRLLLPAGPRLTDQAVLNLNQGGSFDDQVQLYITGNTDPAGNTSQLKFWALQGGDAHWAFQHPVSVLDGLRHSVAADWDADFAQLSVDGVSLRHPTLIANDPPFMLDRLNLGFSPDSGALEGLLAGIEIGRTPLSSP